MIVSSTKDCQFLVRIIRHHAFNPLFPTVFMTDLQPINCFVPASQENSKCVSRNAAILLSNFIKNLASCKIIKIIRLFA